MTPGNPFDSGAKRAVRELWNTPLLKDLNQSHGFRYRYMGLPGVDLIDVNLWRDMIDEVIAFEIPARPTETDPEGRRNIVALRRNLRLLNVPGRAYFGPMEEVVVLRKDYDGQQYDQKKVITLYNLDFCDEIASRIHTREYGGQVWRFEAIRQIFRDQHDAFREHGGPKYFIALLTVRDQMDAEKLRGFLSENLYDDTHAYLEACGGINSLPSQGSVIGTHSWALKAFIYNSLRQYLSNPNISVTFFPLLKYQGTHVRTKRGSSLRSPMLHCMILCRFNNYQSPLPGYRPPDYLTSVSSVTVTKGGKLVWNPEPGEPPTPEGNPSPLQWLKTSGLSLLN